MQLLEVPFGFKNGVVLLPNKAFTLCQQESQQTNQSSQRNTGGSHRNIHKGFQVGIIRCGGGNSTGVEFGAIGEGNDQLAVFIDGNAGNTNAILALYLAEIFLGAIGEGDNQLTIFVELDVGNSNAVRAVYTLRTILAVGSVYTGSGHPFRPRRLCRPDRLYHRSHRNRPHRRCPRP